MKTTLKKTALEIIRADISQLRLDAVVNAANTELWMGGGVAGALKRAGGDEIEREAMAQGPIGLGQAVVTAGHDLAAKWVIHAVVMEPGQPATGPAISGATKSALLAADGNGLRAIALPVLGAGAGGHPIYDAALRIVETVVTYVHEHAHSKLDLVVLCAYDDAGKAAFTHALIGAKLA